MIRHSDVILGYDTLKMMSWHSCWTNFNIIYLLKNCHFQCHSIVSKFKSQYYGRTIEWGIFKNPALKIFSLFAWSYIIMSCYDGCWALHRNTNIKNRCAHIETIYIDLFLCHTLKLSVPYLITNCYDGSVLYSVSMPVKDKLEKCWMYRFSQTCWFLNVTEDIFDLESLTSS